MEKAPIKLASGKSGTVYDLGDETVAKVFVSGTEEKAVKREGAAAELAFEYGLPTPRVISVQTHDEGGCIRFQKVSGVPLSNFVLKRPWHVVWASREMAKCMARIHAVPDTQTPNLSNELSGQIEKAPHLSDVSKAQIIAELEALGGEDRLCHFDFHAANVMVSEEGCFVIDWGAAKHGPPFADLAQSYVINRVDGFPDGSTVWLRLLIRALRALHIEALIAFYGWYCSDQSYRSIKRGIRPWLRPIAAARLADGIEYETAPLLALIGDTRR